MEQFKNTIQKYHSKIKFVFKSMYCRSSFNNEPLLNFAIQSSIRSMLTGRI